MKRLNYQTLKEIGYKGYLLEKEPVKVLQFGEGNFMRAFADAWFDLANERTDWNGKIALVQPTARKRAAAFDEQQGLYTLCLRGIENGERIDRRRVISAVECCLNPYEDWERIISYATSDDLEYITSNTTEAGIVHDPGSAFDDIPPASFPAKLTKLLYERFRAEKPGVVILPCELIDENGKELLSCVNRHADDWNLGAAFKKWLHEENLFCSTLVDRIVPGRIRDPEEATVFESENGYRDDLMDVGEVFGVWYIEGTPELEERLPFKRAGANVHVVSKVAPYKARKVRILNGAHTGFVPGAYLAGLDIVRDCMDDDAIRGFMDRMLRDEIIPVLPLERADCEAFAAAVVDRFRNPFVDHRLLSITLNSTSKWRARNLPSLLEYVGAFGRLPACLTMSLAAYIAFYSSGIEGRDEEGLICRRPAGNRYTVRDDGWVLDFYESHRNAADGELVRAVLGNVRMWGRDLTEVGGLEAQVLADLLKIRESGARAAFASCL